jgi:hypothetical protein
MPTIAVPTSVGKAPRGPAQRPPRPRTRRRRRYVRFRRPCRAAETREQVILRAIPLGSVRVMRTEHCLAALHRHPSVALMNRNRQAHLAAVLSVLIARADFATMTTRPTWALISELTGLSTRSVGRHLATLITLGLLGRVARGRSAPYAPAGPDGKKANEAAVYVLCRPDLDTLVAQVVSGPVRKIGTPPREGSLVVKELSPTHARAKRDTPNRPCNVAGSWVPHKAPRVDQWPIHARTTTKAQRRGAGAQLRIETLSLRALSPRDIASACRVFLVNGWTVHDLLWALDHSPERVHRMDSPMPGDQTAQVRGWLRWRLARWLDSEGLPLPSRSQRLAAERASAERGNSIRPASGASSAAAVPALECEGPSLQKIAALEAMRALWNRSERSMGPRHA